jgi:Glycosyl transferase family 11
VIVTKLQGGHSNQLFQYATGRCLAVRLGVELFMDTQWFGAIAEGDTPRVYELDRYRFDQRFVGADSFTLTGQTSRSWPWRRRGKPTLEHHRQQGHGFDARVLQLPDNAYLEGWWQDERYFKEIRQRLLDELELRDPVAGKNVDWLRRIRDRVSVSVHVRRGDYVTNPATTEFHGVLGVSYYEAALERLAEATGELDFELFVFSNDIDWCKSELDLRYPTTFIDGGNSGPEDMHLMKHCKHHVVANSSFSWWGAWLSEYRAKVVIAPKNWFSDATVNSETEIVPPSWLQI